MLWTRLAGALSVKSRPTFVGVSQTDTGSSNTTTLTLNVPAGVQNGDLLIAVVFGSGGNVNDWVQTSWTWAVEQVNNSPNLGIAYRTASSEPSSYSFTTATSRRLGGMIMAFRGAAWDVTGTLATDTYTASSITVSEANSILIGAWGVNASNQTWTAPSGMTEVSKYEGSNSANFAAYREDVNAGSTGTRTASTGSTSARSCVLFSIKPS